MVRNEFINELQKNTDGKSKKECGEFIDAFVKTVTDCLIKGEEIKLVNFGTFKVRKIKAHTGFDPVSKKKVEVKDTYVPMFKVGKGLKECITRK